MVWEEKPYMQIFAIWAMSFLQSQGSEGQNKLGHIYKSSMNTVLFVNKYLFF